jgi:hypothetical protein
MATNAGQVARFQYAGIDYDPVGDWTIKESRIKREHKESTPQGNHYFSRSAVPGTASGSIAVVKGLDTEVLTNGDDENVLIETVAGIVYRGTMTYTGDAEHAVNEGNLQVELTGELKRL